MILTTNQLKYKALVRCLDKFNNHELRTYCMDVKKE